MKKSKNYPKSVANLYFVEKVKKVNEFRTVWAFEGNSFPQIFSTTVTGCTSEGQKGQSHSLNETQTPLMFMMPLFKVLRTFLEL